MTTLESELSQHARFLRVLARRLAIDDAGADDLVQETLLAALAAHDAPLRRPLPWLTAVLRNRASKASRSDRHRGDRERASTRPAAVGRPMDAAIEIEVGQRLLAYVEALEEPYRSTIFRRYYDAWEPREIAERTEVRLATVKTRLARALVLLRERLDRDGPGGRESWLTGMALLGQLDPTAPSRRTAAVAKPAAWWMALAAGTLVVLVGLRISLSPEGEPASAGHVAERGDPAVVDDLPGLPSAARDESVRSPIQPPVAATTDFAARVLDAPYGAPKGDGLPAGEVRVTVTLRGSLASLRGLPNPPAESDPAHGHEPAGHVHQMGPVTRRVDLLTDSEGQFSTVIPSGAHVAAIHVTESSTHDEAAWTLNPLGQAAPAPLPSDLTRYWKGLVSGSVVDLNGESIAGAVVSLYAFREGKKTYAQALSDSAGQFTIGHVPHGAWLSAELDGWALVAASRLHQDSAGRWEDAEVVMTPTGVLEIEVTGPNGAATATGPVTVYAREGERGTVYEHNGLGARYSAETPILNGRANVLVPSGVALALRIRGAFGAAQRGGVLIPSGDESDMDTPIVVPASGRQRLRIELGLNREVQGILVDPTGARAPGFTIDIERLDSGTRRLGSIPQVTTDHRGEFKFQLSDFRASVDLMIRAEEGQAGKLKRPAGIEELLGTAVQRSITGSGSEPLVIQLAPRGQQTIQGTVHGLGGLPLEAELRIDSEATNSPQVSRYLASGADGSFVATGLPMGTYAVRATSAAYGPTVARNISPGGSPLGMVLGNRKTARIRIVAAQGTAAFGRVRVHVGRSSSAASETDVALAGKFPQLCSSSFAQPGERSPWLDVSRAQRVAGVYPFDRERPEVKNGVVEFSLTPGVYWLGIQPRSLDYQSLARQCTTLVEIKAGLHELTVPTHPTATVSGRLHLAAAPTQGEARLYARLLDETGHIFLGSDAASQLIEDLDAIPCGTRGEFGFRDVPVGEWQIFFGTRAELDAGQPRFQDWINVAKGGGNVFQLQER